MNKARDIQKQILGLLSLQANVTTEAIAEHLKVRPHVVRYQLLQLLKSGALRRTVFVDQRKLGYHICRIIFNLLPQHQTKVLRFLRNHRSSSWIAQNSGLRDFEVELVVQSPADKIRFLTDLGEETGSHLIDPLEAYEEDWYEWGFRVFLSQPDATTPIALMRGPLFNADDIDLRIIRAYREYDDTDPTSLARHIGDAATALFKNIRRYIKKGRYPSPSELQKQKASPLL